MNGDLKVTVRTFGNAHDFSALTGRPRGSCGGRRVRKGDFELLTFPVAGAGDLDQEAVARNVDRLADFFERFGSVDAANVAAIALYESLGFLVFSREQDATRLAGASRDELQMHLRFAPAP